MTLGTDWQRIIRVLAVGSEWSGGKPSIISVATSNAAALRLYRLLPTVTSPAIAVELIRK